MNDTHAFLIILVSGLVTIFLRFLPFFAFRKNRPEFVMYLGKVLPFATMAMLLVYCLRKINFLENPHGIPEIIASLIVVALHVWKKNTLLSIIIGTAIYMFLVQIIFV